MDFNSIIQNIKKQIIHPIYLLQGEEPYYLDKISDYIEDNVLSEAKKDLTNLFFTVKIRLQ